MNDWIEQWASPWNYHCFVISKHMCEKDVCSISLRWLIKLIFLVACTRLYKSLCRSVGWSVRPSVGNAFVKIDEKWPFKDSKRLRQYWTRKKEEQGGRRDEEEGKMRRKEGRGGRSDEESEKNEQVKKWKMKKWLEDASLTSGSCLYTCATGSRGIR